MKANLPKVRSLWLLASMLLSACSQNPQDRLVELGRCYKAAVVIEDRVLLQGVEIALMQSIRDLKIETSPAQFAMLVNERINDELYPAGSLTDSAHVLKKVSDWAASSVCRDAKQQASSAAKP
nr:hypothetical protein [uncultured Albidiferax sp.]